VQRTGATLAASGIERNDRVAIVLPDGPEMAAVFLAVSSIATSAPLNPAYRTAEFEFYFSDLEPKALIVLAGSQSAAVEVARSRGVRVIEVNPSLHREAGMFTFEGMESVEPHDIAGREPWTAADDVALVLHTSGTTARPKAVPFTHANLCASARNISAWLRLAPEDRCLNIMPLFHVHGLIGALLSSLVARAGIVCTPGFHTLRFWDWYEEFLPTWFTAVPSMHQSILARAKRNASLSRSRLRFIRSASAPLSPKLMADLEAVFQVPVIEAYGMTEGSHQIACNPLPPGDRKPGSVGLPANCEVAILGESGARLPPGAEGDIAIRGANVIGGYERVPEANRISFVDGWFLTGDRGKIDADGYVYLLGRTKEIINRGGEKIHPREIDDVLLEHPAVGRALAFSIPDSRLGEAVGAAVVLHEGQTVGSLELREFAAARLADFKIPSQIVFVDQIPTGPTGKLQRAALAARLGVSEIVARGPASELRTPPRTDSERRLAEIWKRVLQSETTSVEDDFFEAGGDSILAHQLCSAMAEEFGKELSFPALFEARTLERIAELLDADAAVPPPLRIVAVDRAQTGREFPLSCAQRQHWFLDRFERGGVNFVYVRVSVLRGPLDAAILSRSLNRIVARHEVLRTSYRDDDGSLVQIVHPASAVALDVVDLTGLPESDRLTRLRMLAREEAWRPMDLSGSLMLRTKLLRLGSEEHALFLTTHHIAADGWSYRLLIEELAELYTAECEKRPAVLPELAIQYADYAVFQQKCLENVVFSRQIEYCTKQLAGAPELLRLPTDRPRPERQSYRGGVESLTLPPDLTAAIKKLGLEQRATLYMVLLAVFQVLLHRYSGDEDLVVGSAMAGRTQVQTQPLIGLFSNVLAMRADLSGDPSFQDFLARTRVKCLDAHANQDVPIEKVIEQLSLTRTASHPAVFQVLFRLQNLGAETAELGPVKLEPFEFDPGTGQFDLSLEIRERQPGLHCALNYNADLYDADTARRILGHYRTLLESVVRDVRQPVSSIEIVPARERRQLLEEWNDTATDFPSEPSIAQLIEARAEAQPNAIAVQWRDEQLTYDQLNRRADLLARRLRAEGVQRGSLVTISLERSLGLAVALLAVLKAGGAYVPLDPNYPKQRLRDVVEDTHCKLLITSSSRLAELAPLGVEMIDIDQTDRVELQMAPLATGARASDPAYVIYTSGSTGRPNGVVVEHRSLVNNAFNFIRLVELQPGDRVLQFNSLNFDTSAEEIFPCWLAGATLVFWPDAEAPSIAQFRAFVERERVTLLDLPTAYWHEWSNDISKSDLASFSCVRTVVIGGEQALAPKLAQWHATVQGRIRLINTYGPTEATITSTACDLVPGPVTDKVSIGRPIANVTLYILDQSRQLVPIGVPGELFIGGAGVARGYLNRPELTAQRFIANPFREAPDPRLYRTGDRARYRSDGSVEFRGRNDDQVKWRGFRIELGEIENALARHPQVRGAACLLQGENGEGADLVAYIVPHGGAPLEPAELRRFLKDSLPGYMLLSRYVFVESLPLTPNGKIDRRALLKLHLPANERAAARAFVAPRNDLEAEIAAVWKDVLKVDGFGIHDNFFELGGHSLKVVQVLSRLHRSLQVDIPLRRVFEGPTIAEMAIAVLESLAAGLDDAEVSGILDELEAAPKGPPAMYGNLPDPPGNRHG
jgi:amino acid adenylation domain-containing protein